MLVKYSELRYHAKPHSQQPNPNSSNLFPNLAENENLIIEDEPALVSSIEQYLQQDETFVRGILPHL